MNADSVRSGLREAWFAALAGLVAGVVTAVLHPTPSPGATAEVTRIGLNTTGVPLLVAALVAGAVAAGQATTAKAAGAWTALGAVPAFWWLTLRSGLSAVVAAETAPETALFGAALLFSLAVGVLVAFLVAVPGAIVGAWGRKSGRSLARRLTAE